ncbi:hypothetical protein G9A89_023016 [Geosiphon pyriformis]|nr:hypothetical protein G9A89_023016 [Geosiphon pyriformis]
MPGGRFIYHNPIITTVIDFGPSDSLNVATLTTSHGCVGFVLDNNGLKPLAFEVDARAGIPDEPICRDSNSACYIVLNFFPEWERKDLKLVEKKGGLTNKLVICENIQKKSKILVRVFGKNSELLIDREQELRTLLSLSKLGLSPPVYGRFQNGIVYGYIPGEHLLSSDFSDFKKSALVARQLALLHSTEVAGPKNVIIWGIIKKWLNHVSKEFSDPKDTERFAKHYKLSDLKQEAMNLQTALEKVRSPIVFCHNDLLHLNIIFNKSDEKISFIDYEYGYYNYRGYDIATFFNEFTGPMYDFTLFPKKDFQIRWLREYLDQSEPGRQITPNELEQMYAEVNKFALLSLFHRGLWCLMQVHFAADLNYDFLKISIAHLDRYFLIRDEVLML